jgi:hypothetical protein
MKKPEELSIEQLKSKEKTLKITIAVLGGVVVLLLLVGMVLTIQKGFTIFSILPVAFLPFLSVLFSILKKTQAEIDTRK